MTEVKALTQEKNQSKSQKAQFMKKVVKKYQENNPHFTKTREDSV